MAARSLLAIHGGEPVRRKPFPPWPRVDHAEIDAVTRVLRNGTWNRTVGEKTLELERRFAEYHEAREAISVTSGFDAIQVALRALGAGPGDEVIMPAYTCIADPLSAMQVGVVPVFADIDPDSACLDPNDFARKITPHTKAVIPVHFGGNVARMSEIKMIADSHGLPILEDAALAQGATWQRKPVGSWADAAIFSFGDDKPMTAGRGGMITTNSAELAGKCRALRDRGRRSYDFYAGFVEQLGWNYRLSELLATVLLCQFEKYPYQVALEERNARYLFDRLPELDCLRPLNRLGQGERNVIDIIMLQCDEEKLPIPKGRLVDALKAEGIPCLRGYDEPLNRHPVMQSPSIRKCPVGCPHYGQPVDYGSQRFPVSERTCRSTLWIWHYAVLLGDERDMDDVFSAFKKVVENAGELAVPPIEPPRRG